jgi:hypothetical protein
VAQAINNLIGADSTAQTFIISTGDMVSDGDQEDDWNNELFAAPYNGIRQMLAHLPFQGAMGNHEKSGVLFSTYLPYPFPPGAGGENGNYWSFDYGKVHVTIIDQYADYLPGSDQYTWLVDDLSITRAKWKVVVIHEPGYASGHHANNTDVQDYIQPLCELYGVQLVFAGHNHYYSRATVNGVVHITTAGGGATLYDPEDGYPFVDTAFKDYHFCKVNVAGNELRMLAINRDGDTLDEFSIIQPSVPYTLPFVEDWESEHGIRKTNGSMYIETNYGWSFLTDRAEEGRVRWGDQTYLPYSGIGAMTIDKFPNNGTYACNSVTLTLDLSSYVSSDILEMDFWWADHNDEDFYEDRIWIRGSDADDWIEFYDLNPGLAPDGTYQHVSGLDIDLALRDASPPQTVSETFQVKFGQKDNSFAPGDGLSCDDIRISENNTKSNPFALHQDNMQKKSSHYRVFTNSGRLFIQSLGKAGDVPKEIQLFDLFGRKVFETPLPASAMDELAIHHLEGYLVVKVVSSLGITMTKVYLD